MQIVRPSEIKGKISAPASKSYAQRAIAIAALAKGRSVIYNAGNSDDVIAATDVIKQLGAEVDQDSNSLIIDGGIRRPKIALNCGEAGLSVRMFSAVAATIGFSVTLTGKGSLLKRPMDVIESSLTAVGATCKTTNGYLPVEVCGPIKGGEAIIDGSFSSQVLSGLLIASPYATSPLTLIVENLKSKPYIDITIDVMSKFGVKVSNQNYIRFFIDTNQKYEPVNYIVEGDWSGAAFPLVAGAVKGEVTVSSLMADSVQADRAVLDALRMAGALITIKENEISVAKRDLNCFKFDATHCPDLFPPLAALAAYCNGVTYIKGVSRLTFKESNRAVTIAEEFGKMGVKIEVSDDYMAIEGGKINGAVVDSRGDHRIAMACAVLALGASSDTEIENENAVAKSYPDFFYDLEKIKK